MRRLALLLPLVLAALSCVSMMEASHPLTPEAKRVELASGGQEVSVELAENCRRVGQMKQVVSEHFAKLEAVEQDANVAQVLSVTTMNGRPYRLDVRFWSCPRSFARP